MSNSCGFGPAVQNTRKSLALAMQTLWLTGQVLPVGARLWVRHEFQSSEDNPVEVIYAFMLPRDATLRRFRVTGENFSVESELEPVEKAREIYEQGIQSGSLATMARNYQDGLVNLSVGNVRPGEKVTVLLEVLAGVELHDDGLRLRFPFTLAPSYHAQARCIEAEPGVGEMELPEREFGDVILPRFLKDVSGLHGVGFDLELKLDGLCGVASPSHSIRVGLQEGKGVRVSLAHASDLPDRDLVLDVKLAAEAASVTGGLDSEGEGHFAVVVPSTVFGSVSGSARKVVILLDRSGSMQGIPIEQAKRAIGACLSTLGSEDEFALVAFDNEVLAFRPHLSKADTDARQAARAFLDGIDARGGTELANGLKAAANILRPRGDNAMGDVLVITDGQVAGTDGVLDAARATGARIHCLGIGSASQDRFLAQLASQTGGVSRFLTPREAVDMAALDLFASIARPVAQEVRVSKADDLRIRPEPPVSVFRGTPMLIFCETGKSDTNHLDLLWQGVNGKQSLRVPLPLSQSMVADSVRLLQGSRLIADTESRATSASTGAVEKRESVRYKSLLAGLSREFGLSSSQMSLVAVAKRAGDLEGEVPKTLVVAVGMPQDMEFASLFRTGLLAATTMSSPCDSYSESAGREGSPSLFESCALRSASPASPSGSDNDAQESVLLFGLASQLEPDGGMPGRTLKQRIIHSLVVLLFLLESGSALDSGPFREHICRLIDFLKDRSESLDEKPLCESIQEVLARVKHYWCPSNNKWRMIATRLFDHGTIDAAIVERELQRS